MNIRYFGNVSVILIALWHVLVPNAFACDPCALYSAGTLQSHRAGSFRFELSEQYTEYDRSQEAGDNEPAESERVTGFSTTRLSGSYDLTESFGLQLNLPLLHRRADVVEGTRGHSETDTGVGDLSLVANVYPFKIQKGDWFAAGMLYAGLKFPTGDTGSLRGVAAEGDAAEEEHSEHDHSDHDHSGRDYFVRNHPIGGASGGRALTLGSGSWDTLFGASALARYQRAILFSTVQYTLRTEGDFDYEFADELVWSAGPGAYIALHDDYTLAASILVSGEHKGRDRLDDTPVAGSQISNLYVGPQLLFTVQPGWVGEVAVDFRVTGEDRDAAVVPEERVRASIGYRF